jgi:acyl carrier protein
MTQDNRALPTARASSRRDKIIAVVAAELRVDPDRCDDTASLDELGADNLDIVSMAADLEQQFSVDLPGGVEDRWVTVGDVVASVEKVLA